MRETRSYGSARGVRSNPYPYRDPLTPDAVGGALLTSPRYRTVTPLRGQNLTPHRAGFATLPDQDHGADRRLLTPRNRIGTRQTARPRHTPARPTSKPAAKEKNSQTTPHELERLGRPSPLPDRAPWPPWNASGRHSAQWPDGASYGFCLEEAATGTCRCRLPLFRSTALESIINLYQRKPPYGKPPQTVLTISSRPCVRS